MVLSRKKLKSKFRSLLAESLVANESKDCLKNALSSGKIDTELKNVRELLVTKSRRPKLPKKGSKKRLQEKSKIGVGVLEIHDESSEKISSKKRKIAEEKGWESEECIKADPKLEKKKKAKQIKKKRRELKLKRKKTKGLEDQSKKNIGSGIGSVNTVIQPPVLIAPSQVDESEANRVYVGGIPYYSSEDDIRSFFEGCGTVTKVDCMTFPESGKFRGIAILSLKTEGASKRALSLDGADMGGFYLKIQPYNSARRLKSDFTPEIINGYNRAYVGNLAWDISDDDLKQFFCGCNISAIRFGADKETGDFKGYAHVDFADSDSLSIALKLDQNIVCGRPARIRCAVPRKSEQTESSSRSHDEKPETTPAPAGKPKKKRQTCYECGVPGHISSECPQKIAAPIITC